jgi:DNA repair protein RecN (Recombination protein N)
MLQQLSISNYALIKELSISPDKGLNIITGETGAGKSIMLGGLGLLLGKRADTKVLFDSSRKCIIEGVFDISDYRLEPLFQEHDVDHDMECIVRREISSSGKSRAFVNDGVVNLDFLRQLGAALMDIHSQHDTLLLGSNTFQLNLVDAFAQNAALKEAYFLQYQDYQQQYDIYEQLVQESSELRKEADYNQFLFDELEKANFQSGEQEQMEADLSKLENAEEIKTRLNEALALTDQSELNINGFVLDLKNTLSQISSYGSSYEQLRERVESILIELKDITSELEQEESLVEYDPERTDEVQERLSLLYKLQQKHQVAEIDELLKIQESLSDKVLRVENLDDAIEAANKDMNRALEKLNKLGDQLSDSRKKIFKTFQTQTEDLLSGLGMPNAKLIIEHKTQEPGQNGKDHIDLLFSANKGVQPQPLKTAASGGEFSRLMFAVKYILADKTALPTIVFDEIDAGISGEVAIQMAQMMTVMAENHQVITITHLPQIAAKGQSHYFVYKDDDGESTASGIRKLNEEQRLLEIAQMIGGKSPSDKTIESAKELLTL